MAKQYELLYILPGTITETDTEPMLEKAKAILTEGKAENLTMYPQGKHRLAYPIRHIRYGYMFVIRFSAEANAIPEMQARLRLLSEPLRALMSEVGKEDAKEPTIRYGREEGQMNGEKPAVPEVDGVALSDVPTAKVEKAESAPAEEVSIADIDKQLDKILDSDIAKV